ncbi:MAG: acetolactate synthase large subunit, partial [Candidatus Hydrogenedentes bacterium]|nr:acetolactate synthase large subunit [Candidatus Hydrogenedentota bacterium]
PVSSWVRTSASAGAAAHDLAEAIVHAKGPPGRIATLIAPADTMREEAEGPAKLPMMAAQPPPDEMRIREAVDVLRKDEPVALLLSGSAVLEPGLLLAGRIAAATGCRVMSDCFPARMERGAGLPMVERMPYFPEAVIERLSDVQHLILIGAPSPVSFFRYPEYPSNLVPESCRTHTLCAPDEDALPYLDALAAGLDAPKTGSELIELKLPDPPNGALTSKSVGAAIAAALPENAIIADESATSGGPAFFLTQTARRHTSMYLTGGGIGMGLPLATGAAVACPDRPVLALQGDGGAMYTLQALWTQAREGLNVTNVIFANRKYQILQVEQARTGLSDPGPIARGMTELTNPEIDWRDLAKGMGVKACRPDSAEALYKELQRGLNEPGPCLIEVVL